MMEIEITKDVRASLDGTTVTHFKKGQNVEVPEQFENLFFNDLKCAKKHEELEKVADLEDLEDLETPEKPKKVVKRKSR